MTPPTHRSLAMPTPPSTISAPLLVEVDCSVERIVAVEETTRPLLTIKSLLCAISFPFHVTACYLKYIYDFTGISNFYIANTDQAVIPNLTTLTVMVVAVVGENVRVTVVSVKLALNTPNCPLLVLIPYSFL